MVTSFFFFLFSRELGDARQRKENGPGREVRVDVDVVWCGVGWNGLQDSRIRFYRKSTVESACKIMRVAVYTKKVVVGDVILLEGWSSPSHRRRSHQQLVRKSGRDISPYSLFLRLVQPFLYQILPLLIDSRGLLGMWG